MANNPIPVELFRTPTGAFYLPTDVPRDAVFRAIVGGTVHGEKTVSKVVALIRPGAIVIDVGSYYGQDTVLFSRALGNSGGKIHTIEASGRVLTILKRNLEVNACDNVDLRVLQGSVETIRRCQMPIVFEYCPLACGPIYGIKWADHLVFIESVGYKLAAQLDKANFLMEPK